MTEWITTARLVEILQGDEELVVRLCDEGIITQQAEGYLPEDVARVLVCRTLVRELDVDISALEIILRLREELLETRHQLSAVAHELNRLKNEER
jgi:hypothetical protein